VEPPRTGNLHIEISVRTLLYAALVVAAAWIVLRVLAVVLILVIALFLVGTLNPVVEWLERRGFGRPAAITSVFASLFVAALLLFGITVPSLLVQASQFVEREPVLRAAVATKLAHTRLGLPLANALRNLHYDGITKFDGATALAYSGRAIEIVAYAMSAIFLALYLMLDRNRVRGGLFALVPRRHHVRLSRIILNLETIVGGYIRGQVVTSTLIGVFTFVLLTACGIGNAVALSVIAGVADVLPYVGVPLAVAPAFVASLSHGLPVALIVLGCLLVYEEIESRILIPRIYGNALRLPSSIVMLALLAGATLGGVMGALLALPVASAIRMLVEELRVDLPGELHGDSTVRKLDEIAAQEYQRRAEGKVAEEAAAIAAEISNDIAVPRV
jgi:predicted PurR-regulated permease PerM